MSTRGRHTLLRAVRRSSRVAVIAVLTASTAATVSYGATTAFAGQEHGATVACDRGVACVWTEPSYAGSLHTWDLRTANPGECIPVPEDAMGLSLGNRTDRDLTIYADASCATDGTKQIYPGGGTFSPHSPFPIAAITIGE